MNAVEVLHKEYSDIIQFLDANRQPSFSSDLNRHFKKNLILSAASYFEHELQSILVDFVSKASNTNSKIVSFFKRKAIGMQYHTYFSWGEKNAPDRPGKNANTFFSLFGDDFKNECEQEIKANEDLDNSIKSFLEIGHLRNILVHSNFAAVNIDNKTSEDINSLFNNGLGFLSFLKSKFIWGNTFTGSSVWKVKRQT
jgi:hypothetical protein